MVGRVRGYIGFNKLRMNFVSIKLLSSCSRLLGNQFQMKVSRYRDFKRSLKQIGDGKNDVAAQQSVESLMLLMKNPSTPQRFWLPLLNDSLKLLNWQDRPLISVPHTNLLLNRLQELSTARLRPDFVKPDLPAEAFELCKVIGLATNLGRAILEGGGLL